MFVGVTYGCELVWLVDFGLVSDLRGLFVLIGVRWCCYNSVVFMWVFIRLLVVCLLVGCALYGCNWCFVGGTVGGLVCVFSCLCCVFYIN